MNDAELDRKLKMGKEQARRFFDGRFDVRGSADAVIERGRKPSGKSHAWRKTCLAGACVTAAAVVCAAVVLASGGHGTSIAPQPSDTALPEQTVCLSGDKEYRMNYIPVDMPDDGGGLITVLRETGDADSRIAYYSLFETGDTVYPALVLPFPNSDYDMLLIVTGDSAHRSLGYRLIGFKGDALATWWSQDGVPSGLLSMSDGVAVEHRGDGNDTFVTYIVPIQVSAPGSIALPVENLHMAVGERILLIGADSVDATSESGLLAAEEQPQTGGVSAVMLKALRAGKDIVSVGSSRENARTLSVDIGE